MKQESRHCQMKELKDFVTSRSTLGKKMAKESSLNIGNVKRRNLGTSKKREVTETAKMWVDFPSFPEYSNYVSWLKQKL